MLPSLCLKEGAPDYLVTDFVEYGCRLLTSRRFSWDTVLPLFVKQTFNWTSTAAGLLFFAIFIPGFISPVVGHISDRYGARWPSLAGFLTSVPLVVCMRFVTEDTLAHKVLLGALLSLLGAALAFANTPLTAEITYAIEAEEAKTPGVFGAKGVYGLGYGMFCTSWALGGSVGSLMSGYVMAARGWGTLTWAVAVLMAGGAVVVGLFVGARPEPVTSEDEELATGTRQEGPRIPADYDGAARVDSRERRAEDMDYVS